MNYNTSVYAVFILMMVFIILYVGKFFYKNGRIFILSLMKGNVSLTDSINNILLAGYYLVNIGYTFIILKSWPEVENMEDWISSLAINMGFIILLLSILHYFNMLVIHLLSGSNFFTNKPTTS